MPWWSRPPDALVSPPDQSAYPPAWGTQGPVYQPVERVPSLPRNQHTDHQAQDGEHLGTVSYENKEREIWMQGSYTYFTQKNQGFSRTFQVIFRDFSRIKLCFSSTLFKHQVFKAIMYSLFFNAVRTRNIYAFSSTFQWHYSKIHKFKHFQGLENSPIKSKHFQAPVQTLWMVWQRQDERDHLQGYTRVCSHLRTR